MIVLNEANNIEKVLESAKPHIDRFCILDTGSTDGTQEIVKRVLHDVPGVLHEGPFVDYADARNRALELATAAVDPAIFQFVLSGDEFVRAGDKLREHLEKHRDSNVDCHRVRVFINDTTLDSPRIVRTGSAWKYEGKIHECLVNHEVENAPTEVARDCAIEHIVTDWGARCSAIWERHIPMLKETLDENPGDERALIFLAQSYAELLRFMPAWEVTSVGMEAMSLILRRLAIETGTEAERNYLRLQYLDIAKLTGIYTDEEMFARAEALAKDDPLRPEVQVLHAYAAFRAKQPAQLVYHLASNAAYIAMKVAEELDNSSPISASCCWRAHLLAAMSAEKIAEKYPADDAGKPWTQIAREHAEAGVVAGGPEQQLQTILSRLDGTVMTPISVSLIEEAQVP